MFWIQYSFSPMHEFALAVWLLVHVATGGRRHQRTSCDAVKLALKSLKKCFDLIIGLIVFNKIVTLS